jgi:hypothetical protein
MITSKTYKLELHKIVSFNSIKIENNFNFKTLRKEKPTSSFEILQLANVWLLNKKILTLELSFICNYV